MKTLKIWMFGLLLPAIAIAPACEKDDDDSDDGADDGDDDDGDDDGGDDDGGDDDGGDTFPDDGGDTFPDDDGGDTFPDDDGGDDAGDDDGGDDGPTGGAVGDQCMADSDCADDACIFAGDADYGFCSTVCDSFADCPSFWECEPVGNASANYCVPGE